MGRRAIGLAALHLLDDDVGYFVARLLEQEGEGVAHLLVLGGLARLGAALGRRGRRGGVRGARGVARVRADGARDEHRGRGPAASGDRRHRRHPHRHSVDLGRAAGLVSDYIFKSFE